MQRGRPPEEDRGQHGDGEREDYHPRIERERRPARRLIGQRCDQHLDRPVTDHQSERAAGDREQDVFDQQLPKQARPAGAHREANADLAPAGERAREHQRCHVGAGHGEQQCHCGAKRGCNRAELARELRAQLACEWRDDTFLVVLVEYLLLHAQ